MAKSFYAVMIHWDSSPTDAKVAEIDQTLGVLGDWLRFGGHNWLLWSESSAHDIFQLLAGRLAQKDSELIVKWDPHSYAGWAPKWVEDWVTERRDGSMRLVSPPAKPPLPPYFPPFDAKKS
jgi:hypothetical protein